MSIEWPATLVSYCNRLTKSQIDAEDLFQQTLLQALPVVTGEQTHPNRDAYLRRIAKHLWIDHRRSAKRREQPQDPQTLKIVDQPDAPDRLDIESAFRVLLTALTPLEHTTLLLHDVYMLTARETAEKLHSTESAVKATLRRARGKLRNRRSDEDLGEVDQSALHSDIEKDLLNAYVAAFQNHNIAALVRLGQLDTLDGRAIQCAA